MGFLTLKMMTVIVRLPLVASFYLCIVYIITSEYLFQWLVKCSNEVHRKRFQSHTLTRYQ